MLPTLPPMLQLLEGASGAPCHSSAAPCPLPNCLLSSFLPFLPQILVIAVLMRSVLGRSFNLFQWEALFLLVAGITGGVGGRAGGWYCWYGEGALLCRALHCRAPACLLAVLVAVLPAYPSCFACPAPLCLALPCPALQSTR